MFTNTCKVSLPNLYNSNTAIQYYNTVHTITANRGVESFISANDFQYPRTWK